METIEKEIQKCNKCSNLIKLNFNTISYGKNNDILFIGESPAKNGWIVTGKAFYNINGKLLATARILNELLKKIDLTIDDITFTEACKCSIPDRKLLKECSANCFSFLEKQIGKLKSKILIPLGEHPTRILLKDIAFKKFSDVVGKTYTIKINNTDIIVIPIYHPSPINPKGYKNNIGIFETIKQVMKNNDTNG